MVDNEANAPLAHPKPEGPTDRESFSLWEEMRDGMESYPSWRDFDDFARAFLARWGRPAIQPVAVAEDQERLRIMEAGIRYGYKAGHHDTVEACYGDPDDLAADYAPEILEEMQS
jgi:hypothetical protein